MQETSERLGLSTKTDQLPFSAAAHHGVSCIADVDGWMVLWHLKKLPNSGYYGGPEATSAFLPRDAL